MEGTYTRDLDGDGIQEVVHYIYTYDDASIDEVQVNSEGWTLITGLIVDNENVYEGYDYYKSMDGTIWFAVNSGTSVVEISLTGAKHLNTYSYDGTTAIAGYNKKIVNEKFKGIISALSYGAPPHGGIAPGIDRIVMLLAEEKNIREVTMFPMNQNAQDLLMGAPLKVTDKQLKDLGIKVLDKKK